MNLKLYDLPFTDAPFDEKKAEELVQETETYFDSWVESLRD